ncbi:MAG: molybdenum cofactor guanylyltransferase [Planctomycetes bacterium]|nr:molybdenum cofactor guanylyltransferase [Planctomycetota bacterium]
MGERASVTGAILAGGASRRMGRRKEVLPAGDGVTMIERVESVLAPLTSRVVVVGDTPALPDHERVFDLRPDQGPLGGIEALLASGLDRHFLVVPCDMPRLTTDLLALLAVGCDEPATVFRLKGTAEPYPLPVRLDVAALPMVRRHLDEGRRALRDLLAALRPRIVDVAADRAGQLANVNTPAEHSALLTPRREPPCS